MTSISNCIPKSEKYLALELTKQFFIHEVFKNFQTLNESFE